MTTNLYKNINDHGVIKFDSNEGSYYLELPEDVKVVVYKPMYSVVKNDEKEEIRISFLDKKDIVVKAGSTTAESILAWCKEDDKLETEKEIDDDTTN